MEGETGSGVRESKPLTTPELPGSDLRPDDEGRSTETPKLSHPFHLFLPSLAVGHRQSLGCWSPVSKLVADMPNRYILLVVVVSK